MTTNLRINPNEGSDIPQQRWMEALRGGLRSTAEALGVNLGEVTKAQAAAGIDASERVGQARSRAMRSERADFRSDLLSEVSPDRRTSRAALDAHAATGALAVRRAAYDALERSVNDSVAAVRAQLDQVATGDSIDVRQLPQSRPAASTGESSTAVAARRDGAASGIDAAAEVAAGRDRLLALRERAMQGAREAADRVNALARDIAADNRQLAQAGRANAREAGASEAAENTADALAEVRSRRDQAVREIARLTGATASAGAEGAIDVSLDGRILVGRGAVREVEVRSAQEVSARLDRPGMAPTDSGQVRGRERSAATHGTDGTAATRRERDELAGDVVTVPRLAWTSGRLINGVGGVIAAQLEQAAQVLPEALARWEEVGRAVASIVAAPGSVQAGEAADAQAVSPSPRRLAVDAARQTLADVESAWAGRAKLAERRLDVMAVVDAVLVGAPMSQVGGLVSTALGGRAESVTAAGSTGQRLVSALQSVDAVTSALTRTASGVVEDLARVPVAFASSDPSRVQVMALPAGDSGDATSAALGFEADVAVLSIAQPTVYASAATFTPTDRLEAQLAIGLTVAVGALEPPRRTIVTVPAGAGIRDVAAAIDAAQAGIRADLAPAGADAVRLLLTAQRPGGEVSIGVSDGHLPGRASDVLGGFLRTRRGADTVVQVTQQNGEVTTLTASGPTIDGVLPSARLVVAGEPTATTGQSTALINAAAPELTAVRVSARPDAAVAAQHAATLVAGAASVLDTIRGRAVVDAATATALAQDPVVTAIAERLTTSLTGGEPGGRSFPGFRPPEALPGLRVDAEDRVAFDARTFAQAFAQDSGRVSAQLRSMADDLVRIATDASSGPMSALAVRIHAEQTFAQEYSSSAGDVDDRSKYRQDVLENRAAAMTSLLERLSDEQRWLDQALR